MKHLEAKAIVDSLGLTAAESLYLRMVGNSEGGYGEGWYPSQDTITLSQAHGLTGFEGLGSNNWGAEIGTGDAGSFRHVDRDADGKVYVASFRKWSTPAAGARSLAATLLKPNVKAALAKGDLNAAVAAQIEVNHYTGNPPATPKSVYLARLKNSLQSILSATGEPNPFGGTMNTDPLDGVGVVLPSSDSRSSSAAWVGLSLSLLRTCPDVKMLATLRLKSEGPDVAYVRMLLGLPPGSTFDTDMARRVSEYQSRNGLVADHVIGPKTWASLRRSVGGA